MSKHSKKHKPEKARRPPRFRRVAPGQIWRVQRVNGNPEVTHPVVTCEIDEVTPETIVVRWLDDCAVRPKPNAMGMRFARADFKFLEKVA